ncbi:MAG: DVUA0089 family protein, partial [Phycisphaerales bacterium]|nr:DVUA0089 family protein [Phycisphaerales bacterium]
VPNLSGPLNSIRGSLTGNAFGPGGSDFQDMYKIFIPTPSAFFAESLVVAGGFDIQLWLFDESGLGVLGNDNAMSITDQAAFGPATDDATPGLVAPGIYYLAISGAGSDPFSAGGEIFDFATPTEVSGPDGLGGSLPIAFWTEPGAIGEYYIELTGVEFVPAPATLLVLGFGGLLTARGRRRSA